MANPSKAKGTAAETAVVRYLQTNGFPFAERRALNGSLDRGDIAGITDTVIEVKAAKTLTFPQWLRELAVEMGNDDAGYGVVIAKRRGTTDVGEWFAVMTTEMWVDLMRQFTDLSEALLEANADLVDLQERSV